MANIQPASKSSQSLAQRIRQLGLKIIEPHSSIQSIDEFRRAQLLSSLTLISIIFLIGAILSRPRAIGIFLALGGISLVAYFLSRTNYYRFGAYLFAYAFTAIAFINIYQGNANSIDSAIASTVYISLIISSVLLSQSGFLSLAVLSTLATFMAPLYSKLPITGSESIAGTGSIVLVMGVALYGIQIFRGNLEKEALKGVTDSNRTLEEVTNTFERLIDARTLELEKANKQAQDGVKRFQAVSEISQEIASNIDQESDALLNRITQIVSEKLGFYHVGIFLLDENHEFAFLRAANSDGGKRMLKRHHQLKVGGTGIVGYASQAGRARIALDTGSDAVFFNNLDLPNTRSEIALPLLYGEKILGVLDVQSTVPSAFKDEDINLLSTLANQITIVINTVVTNKHSGLAPTSIKINQRSRKFRDSDIQGGYTYSADGTISEAGSIDNPTINQAILTGEVAITTLPTKGNPSILAVPVKFRDQVIGIIQIETGESNRKWTEDEVSLVQSISDRAAFALENARLLEETARRADHEETVASVTTSIGSSSDFNHILQITVQELGRVLGASRSFIQMGTPENENSTAHSANLNTVNLEG